MHSRLLRRKSFARTRAVIAHWCSTCAGNTFIELALVLPVLLIVSGGAYEFGRLAFEQAKLNSAARAGTQYGVQIGTMIVAADMIRAARNDAGDTAAALDITARTYCRCSDASIETVCTVTCPGDWLYAPRYVEVVAKDTIDLVFTFTGIANRQLLRGASTMRIR